MKLELKAPSGTISPMTGERPLDSLTSFENLTNWHITTLFHWGESPVGEWELSVQDFAEETATQGTLYSWSLILYGTTSDPPISRVFTMVHSAAHTTTTVKKTPKSTFDTKKYTLALVTPISVVLIIALIVIVSCLCHSKKRSRERNQRNHERNATWPKEMKQPRNDQGEIGQGQGQDREKIDSSKIEYV